MKPGKPIKTCATCEHGVYIDPTHVECYGAPPTPIMVAAGQDKLGRNVLKCELIRPRIAHTDRACAVHQPREAGEVTGVPATAIDAPRPQLAGLDLSRFKPDRSN